MIKRAIAISLLFLANTVLLAVAVVPHHHHGETICFVGSHCHHGHGDAGGDCPHDSQQAGGHGHNTGASCCNVSQWLLPDIEPEHKHQHHCICTVCDHAGDAPVAILPDFSEPVLQPVNLPFRQTPPNDTVLQIFAGRIHGLRAPPFNGTLTSRT